MPPSCWLVAQIKLVPRSSHCVCAHCATLPEARSPWERLRLPRERNRNVALFPLFFHSGKLLPSLQADSASEAYGASSSQASPLARYKGLRVRWRHAVTSGNAMRWRFAVIVDSATSGWIWRRCFAPACMLEYGRSEGPAEVRHEWYQSPDANLRAPASSRWQRQREYPTRHAGTQDHWRRSFSHRATRDSAA